MYIFVKIHENKTNGTNTKPFVIEETSLEKALDTICEKYYGVKFTSIMSVIHYPRFLQVLQTIKEI